MELKAGILPTGEDRKAAINEMLRRQSVISEQFIDTRDFDTMLKNFTPFAADAQLMLDLDRKFGLICDLYDKPRSSWSIIGREIMIDGGTTEGYVVLCLATDFVSDRREGFVNLFNAVRRIRANIHLRSNDMLKFQLVEIKNVELVRTLTGNPQQYQKEDQ